MHVCIDKTEKILYLAELTNLLQNTSFTLKSIIQLCVSVLQYTSDAKRVYICICYNKTHYNFFSDSPSKDISLLLDIMILYHERIRTHVYELSLNESKEGKFRECI